MEKLTDDINARHIKLKQLEQLKKFLKAGKELKG